MNKKNVVIIGNFDGVHLGHRDIIAQGRVLANHHGYGLTILTFSPHPRQFFMPNIAPFRITPDAVKNKIFQEDIRPDHYEIMPFDDDLHHKQADDFIRDILIDKLNAVVVLVGQDFHFGYKRSGTIQTLKNRDEFDTMSASLLEIGDIPVTSTRIRDHLKKAEMGQANALLGWEWFIQNEVVHGDKRGRELGYPTANMHFGDTIVPSHGIYAVRVKIEGEDQWRQGAANIGIRPMFETAMPMVETFIFDFDDDLYGKQLKIMPIQKIRDEMKFDDLDALKDQMKQDCIMAKNILHKE